MSATINVKPAPGRLVRDPQTGMRVPDEGRAVPRTSYWLRRMHAGDLVEVVEVVEAAPEPQGGDAW